MENPTDSSGLNKGFRKPLLIFEAVKYKSQEESLENKASAPKAKEPSKNKENNTRTFLFPISMLF
jgi:hypothetical protein